MKKQSSFHLQDYSPPDYFIPTIDLVIELNPKNTRVTACLRFVKNPETSPLMELFLNGEDLDLKEIKINGEDINLTSYRLEKNGLVIINPPKDFTLETRVIVQPETNTQLEGIYLSGNILCTQCEAEGFRRITYSLDRPDILSVYTVTLIANQELYPTLLSNGNRVSDRCTAEAGNIQEVFFDPYPKPSYLFALVAGKLEELQDNHITQSGRRINLAIYSEPGKIDRCSFAMEALKAAMKWEEEVYGLEYDLNDYKIVAIDSFNMGAMENKGLNIFNSNLVFYDYNTATDRDLERVASTIAHEYCHNWTGNRVTVRDWFQLTLKEGLTVFRDRCFSADHFSASVIRIRDAFLLRSLQFPEDNGPLSHPIQPNSYESINNFYTMTVYEKGAEVVGMYETILGKRPFIQAVREYLRRHDGKAATVEDFFASMQSLTNKDLSQFRRWYHTAGTPVIQVETSYDRTTKTYRVKLRQSIPANPEGEPLLIPLSFSINFLKKNTVISPYHGLWLLREKEETRIFQDIETGPRFSLNENFSAPVKVARNFTWKDWVEQFRYETNPFLKWDALQQCYLSCFNEKLSDSDFDLKNAVKHLSAAMEPIWDPINSAFSREDLARYFLEYGSNNHKYYGDCAFLAQLLIFPSFFEVAESVKIMDFNIIYSFIHEFRKLFVSQNESRFKLIYSTLHSIHCQSNPAAGDEYSLTLESVTGKRNPVGERELKNQCLKLLVGFNGKNYQPTTLTQWKLSQRKHNFNDELMAFKCILLHPGAERDIAIEEFYQRWKKDNLVINRWLESLAEIEEDNTLDRIVKLQLLPEFNLKEPNKCRSLFRTFIRNNPFIFNHPSGEGYRIIADAIITLDQINPLSAADLLVYWPSLKKLKEPQKSSMTKELFRIKNNCRSKDVLELAGKQIASD